MTAETTAPTVSSAAKRTRKRILTGDRPTGKLHLGHYVGTLANRVTLQDEYETFLLIADYHMLTTRLDNLDEIEQHVEITREIARRFNQLFGPVFPEPRSLLPTMGLLPGTDGREKMGKSLNNAINLSDDPKTIERKVMRMYTDPNRVSPTTPGTIEGNPVFIYLDTFGPDAAEVAELKKRYAAGTVGDVEVKRRLVEVIERFVAPVRERRNELAA